MIIEIINSSDVLFYNKQTLALQTFTDYTANPAGFIVKRKNGKHSFFAKMTVDEFNTDNNDNQQGVYLYLRHSLSDEQYNTIRNDKIDNIVKSFNSVLKGMNTHIFNHHMNSINRYNLLVSDQMERDKSIFKLANEYLADGSNDEIISRYASLYDISKENYCNSFIAQYNLIQNSINTGLSAVDYVRSVFINLANDGTIKEVTNLSITMRSKIGDYPAMMKDCETLLNINNTVEVLPELTNLQTTIGG